MAGTTNDDDLLILSDDSDSGTDFVLDDAIIDDNKNSSNSEDLISFDTDLASFGNEEVKIEKTEISNSLDGFSLDFSDTSSSDIELPIIEKNEIIDELPQYNVNNEDNFSFGMDETVNQENIETIGNTSLDAEKKEKLLATDTFVFGKNSLPSNNSNNTGTMADILDEAIAKFSKREEMIALDISSKEEHIKALKEKIASLESDVNSDNEEVTRLNIEKQAIIKNRKSLEKMKETPVITK